MDSIKNTLQNLPEWYGMERRTEKTMERLTTVKELVYYLKNPDEYIRHLAIIRLSQLKLKDSINILGEILDDNAECNENKELAAWAVRATALKWDMDIFINHKYLSRFTGTETYDELFKITKEDTLPSIRFDFSKNPAFPDMRLELQDNNCIHDICFYTKMEVMQWFNVFLSNLFSNFASKFSHMLIFLLRILWKAAAGIFFKLPGMAAKKTAVLVRSIKRPAHRSIETYIAHTPRDYYGKYGRDIYKRPGLSALVKSMGFNILYVLLFPLRLVLRHKAAAFITVAALYCILSFTWYGKIISFKYLNMDFVQFQKNTVNTVKEFSLNVWGKFEEISGISNLKKSELPQTAALEAGPKDKKQFSVTAVNGLNIRKSPDASSEKIAGEVLSYGSIVIYLSKSMSDSSGRLWYYVLDPRGRTGWVSARFLEEKKEG